MKFILRFDGTNFTELGIESNYDHSYSYFSTYQSKPLIIGGCDSSKGCHNKMEILESGTAEQEWIQMPDYPYGSK